MIQIKRFLSQLVIFILLALGVTATECWDYTNKTECESAGCIWRSDPWGSWCEEVGCWSFLSEQECLNNQFNKSCVWFETSIGWCSKLDCWAFDGTNKTTCENNPYGLECSWIETYDPQYSKFPCRGPPEKGCWNYSTEAECEAVAGCKWGVCMKLDCWDYSNTDKDTCESHVGFNGKNCVWKVYSDHTECVESGCWDYTNKTECEANNCSWSGSSCYNLLCTDFSYTNESSCVNNSAGLNCRWNNPYCEEKGCWNYNTANSCNNALGCFWETYQGGWCEEVGCWNFDGRYGGNESSCVNNSAGLNCIWDSSTQGCYENITAKSCNDMQNERDCIDTFYCWWNYTDGTCNDPMEGVIEPEFEAWNPGCFIFDIEPEICENTTGCYWDAANAKCITNTTIIPNRQLNCSLINNQTVCNSIPILSTCCKWVAGECVADKFDDSCKEEMQEPPEGAYYCDDYKAYTNENLCKQIAGYPWFMPCKWNNQTERCEFKKEDIFVQGKENIMVIDNKKGCEAAGGRWVVESYCSTNDPTTAVAIPMGRCEFKFDEERNCDKECFACEFKPDKTNWSTKEEMKKACIESKLGICEFIEDPNAPNGYGYCEPKEEFKEGLASNDCDSDCSACTYMGDPTASSPDKRPKYFCENSKANCKWIPDPKYPNDQSKGRCGSKSEKTCEEKCDKCYDETSCKNIGAKKGDPSLTAQCEWENGICKPLAESIEICWDGVDNNNNQKIDCADSMCFSDPFCGGGFAFEDFGKDCFVFDNNETCVSNGCIWVQEAWGSWCDMPMGVCWKFDGTNESYCENNSVTGDACEWHSGFGGICKEDFSKIDICIGKNESECNALENCSWIIDPWCQESGGWCDPNPDYGGEWYDCAQHDKDGNETCEAAGTADNNGIKPCDWHWDPWCQQQAGGYCDHKKFSCLLYTTNESCTNTTNNNDKFCQWVGDPDTGWCESKITDCWLYNQTVCEAVSDCKWISGFCDPKGFGGEMMPLTSAAGGLGGFGMECFKYDGNQTGCENITGCGWFEEPIPFCNIDISTNCPQYSYDRAVCENVTITGGNCIWNPTGFCDEKPFECLWNQTLQTEEKCNSNPLCQWNFDHCEPICFKKTTESECKAIQGCRWISGWCNPAMATEFFKEMEKGAPIPLGTDIKGDASPPAVDIVDFGMKDMGKAFGFGIRVDDFSNASACNGIKTPSGLGRGNLTTKFYWYFDTDGDITGNCKLLHDPNEAGYEFFIKSVWRYDSQTDKGVELSTVYRCSNGNWTKAEIATTTIAQKMCNEIGGGMIAIEKTEFEKYSDLYIPGTDIRVVVATANESDDETNPTDTATPAWVTPGAIEFDVDDLDIFKFETDAVKKSRKEGAERGYIKYADCWTAKGCADYSCKGHPYCRENNFGVEAPDFTDTKTPKIIGVMKETYPDSALITYFTDKPANGTLEFYGNDSTCSNLNATILDIGVISNESRDYKLWHVAEIYNDGGLHSLDYSLNSDTRYYFKLKVCDENGKCGVSKCASFITEHDTNCPFCKFVTRIDVPPGWDVYYDLDQDGNYEHWQGHVCGPNAGMKTNYSIGRRANIKLVKSDNSTYFEFINVRLTKTGLNTKVRDIKSVNALEAGTTTDVNGNTIGYVGMISETRDKIVHNLHPEICYIKIPGTGTCKELWHCDDSGTKCVNRTAEAKLNQTGSDYCIWQIPYCEFSIWAGGKPGTGGESEGAGGGSSGGGGGACIESWSCTDWSPCSPSGKQYRICTDLNNCGTTFNKPIEVRSCLYPTTTTIKTTTTTTTISRIVTKEATPPTEPGSYIGEIKEHDGIKWKWDGTTWVKEGTVAYEQIGLEAEKKETKEEIEAKPKLTIGLIIVGLVVLALITYGILKKKRFNKKKH